MLQREHSVILLTFIKLPFVIKTFVLSIFEWPFYTGFTVFKLDKIKKMILIMIYLYELRHEISNNVVCETSKGSDQPAHMHSLVRAFASHLNIL